MKLQDQVCILEQAKRLKELGVGQLTSQYSFVNVFENVKDGVDVYGIALWHREMFNMWTDEFSDCKHVEELENYSAFTVAELGAALQDASEGVQFTDFKDWITHWDESFVERFPTEAQGRAALLLNFLETGKITADEVNQRLNA